MTSKKTAKDKQAVLPRSSDYTKEFLADWQRLSRSGRYDMGKLKQVMMLIIANNEPLGAEWVDHALSGNQWKNCRETTFEQEDDALMAEWRRLNPK